MKIDGLLVNNVGGYSDPVIQKRYGLFHFSFEARCGEFRVKVHRIEPEVSGTCGVDPGATLSMWRGKRCFCERKTLVIRVIREVGLFKA